ncbi:MAG: DUF721 domain-containing protein [Bacteroidales bacterium]|nr:DUF721 domain-containing protein [Bacteroidales bacterium]
MNDPNQNTVGELIRAFYEEHKGSEYLDGLRIINGWSSVVGPFIAQFTKDLHIKEGVLFVRLSSDSLRAELGYSKSVLMKNLNQLVGYDLLTDIVFR